MKKNYKPALITRCKLYSKHLGIKAPRIVWSNEERKLFPTFVWGKRSVKSLGERCLYGNMIYIAYDEHKTLDKLDSTLIHELIHIRFPEFGCGTRIRWTKDKRGNLIGKTMQNHSLKFESKMHDLKIGKTWKKFNSSAFIDKNLINQFILVLEKAFLVHLSGYDTPTYTLERQEKILVDLIQESKPRINIEMLTAEIKNRYSANTHINTKIWNVIHRTLRSSRQEYQNLQDWNSACHCVLNTDESTILKILREEYNYL